ncbi:hypothetical protein VTH82DRAFT_3643 [Thermothelomyces myriococcoides]
MISIELKIHADPGSPCNPRRLLHPGLIDPSGIVFILASVLVLRRPAVVAKTCRRNSEPHGHPKLFTFFSLHLKSANF